MMQDKRIRIRLERHSKQKCPQFERYKRIEIVPLYVTIGNSRNEKYFQTSITGRNVDPCARGRLCPPPPKAKIAALYGSHQVAQPGSARMAHGDYSQDQAMMRKGAKSIFLVTRQFPIQMLTK
jgi:hypothetical protein